MYFERHEMSARVSLYESVSMYVINPVLFPLLVQVYPSSPVLFCFTVVAQQVSKSCLLCFVDNVLVTSDSPCLTTPARDYEITYGLMILSKKELKNQTVMPTKAR